MKLSYILARLTIPALSISSAKASSVSLALPLADIASLKTQMQAGLGVLFLFGFFWGVVKIWGGADRMSKGDADGKMGIVAGVIIGGAAAIMGALFIIFGMNDGVLTPSFSS